VDLPVVILAQAADLPAVILARAAGLQVAIPVHLPVRRPRARDLRTRLSAAARRLGLDLLRIRL
jgi:hypothetical protein